MQALTRNRFRKNIVGLASLLSFLLFVGTAPLALAADDWPTWPPKRTTPAPEESPKGTISEEPVQGGVPASPAPTPAADAAAKAGKTAGKSASAGISKGTMGWAAAIIGAGVLIGVAAGGGGGGSSSNH